MGVTATSRMILPVLKEVILIAARRIDMAIIDVISDEKWHRLWVHSVAQAGSEDREEAWSGCRPKLKSEQAT